MGEGSKDGKKGEIRQPFHDHIVPPHTQPKKGVITVLCKLVGTVKVLQGFASRLSVCNAK